MFNFVCDRIVLDKAYPALTPHSAEPYTQGWREFIQYRPYTVPCELIEHCREFGVDYHLLTTDDALPEHSWYIIGIGWFDFETDYFGLMSDPVHALLRSGAMRVLFYYHEGDNPYHIRNRLDSLCDAYRLPLDSYRFVSGNTAADAIPGFVYFADHELLYWRRNSTVPATPFRSGPRPYDFTALSRTHKQWRATAMTDLWRRGLLTGSQWSYNTEVAVDEAEFANPLEQDSLVIRADQQRFLAGAPYSCDTLDSGAHNDHGLTNTEHYTDSYCNLVLETHFDADRSGGTFLTEKTFKPIKHGQPFVVLGPPGSLAQLRRMGYRTFDHVIDNAYDLERNNTMRWFMVADAIRQLKNRNLAEWIDLCRADVLHNQQLFVSSKADRLNRLLTQLNRPL